MVGSVTFKSQDAITAIGHDDGRCFPLLAKVKAIAQLDGNEAVLPCRRLNRFNGFHGPATADGARGGVFPQRYFDNGGASVFRQTRNLLQWYA